MYRWTIHTLYSLFEFLIRCPSWHQPARIREKMPNSGNLFRWSWILPPTPGVRHSGIVIYFIIASRRYIPEIKQNLFYIKRGQGQSSSTQPYQAELIIIIIMQIVRMIVCTWTAQSLAQWFATPSKTFKKTSQNLVLLIHFIKLWMCCLYAVMCKILWKSILKIQR